MCPPDLSDGYESFSEKYRDRIADAFCSSRVMIIVGRAGSGKTTYIPRMLFELSGRNAKVACTQPRRIAAVSSAKRVASSMGVQLGTVVGYSVRFDDCSGDSTLIKYLTDGMLAREAEIDPLLHVYSVLILDETHERSISTDVLLGLAKHAQTRRPELKIVIMSATINPKPIQEYFVTALTMNIDGPTFPVEIHYLKRPKLDYLNSAIGKAIEIHAKEPPGDILMFLTGEDEIQNACRIINSRLRKMATLGPIKTFPLYSALPLSRQQDVFKSLSQYSAESPRTRRLIVSTNIAETSLTIEGIVYVIDTGMSKQKMFDPRTGVEHLAVRPISKASAAQRAGRAGRICQGKCFRLYTEEQFVHQMVENSEPEILRSCLSGMVLQLRNMGFGNILEFEFLDKPHPESLMQALETLIHLNILDSDGNITYVGRQLRGVPLDPRLARLLAAGCEHGCLEEMLTIASMLSSTDTRCRDLEELVKLPKHSEESSDHIRLLQLYERAQDEKKNTSAIQQRINTVEKIRKQLERIISKLGIRLQPGDGRCKQHDRYDSIKKALVSGFFTNVAYLGKRDTYVTLKGGMCATIHPSTSVYGRPKWILYHECTKAPKPYLRIVTSIRPEWLSTYFTTYIKDFPDNPARKELQNLLIRRNTSFTS